MNDDEAEIARIAGADPVVPRRRHRKRPVRAAATAGKMRPVIKTHKPRKHHEPEMSPEQREVLEQLGEALIGATFLARALGRTLNSVNGSLYALQRRGLAERVPRQGWRLT